MDMKSQQVPLFGEDKVNPKVYPRKHYYSQLDAEAISQPTFKVEGESVELFVSAEHNCAEMYHPRSFNGNIQRASDRMYSHI